MNKGKLTDAQRKLVEDNIALVGYAINQLPKSYLTYIEREDMEAIAYLALSKAALIYNPDLGYKFSTYAVNAICMDIKSTIVTMITRSQIATITPVQDLSLEQLNERYRNVHTESLADNDQRYIDEFTDLLLAILPPRFEAYPVQTIIKMIASGYKKVEIIKELQIPLEDLRKFIYQLKKLSKSNAVFKEFLAA